MPIVCCSVYPTPSRREPVADSSRWTSARRTLSRESFLDPSWRRRSKPRSRPRWRRRRCSRPAIRYAPPTPSWNTLPRHPRSSRSPARSGAWTISEATARRVWRRSACSRHSAASGLRRRRPRSRLRNRRRPRRHRRQATNPSSASVSGGWSWIDCVGKRRRLSATCCAHASLFLPSQQNRKRRRHTRAEAAVLALCSSRCRMQATLSTPPASWTPATQTAAVARVPEDPLRLTKSTSACSPRRR